MELSLVSEPTTWLIQCAALVFAGLSVGLIGAALLVSQLHHARICKQARLDAQWQQWLLSCSWAGTPPQAKTLREKAHLVKRWEELLLSVEGLERDVLVQKALASDLPAFLLYVLRHPRRRSPKTLESCLTLTGLLQVREALPFALELLSSTVRPVSFSAAMAVVRIAPEYVAHVLSQADVFGWSRAALVSFLKICLNQTVVRALKHQIRTRPAQEGAKLLLAWAQLPGNDVLQFANELLKDPRHADWLLTAALRLQNSPMNLPVCRKYLSHPEWAVRMQAARAVARLGHGTDFELVKHTGVGGNWWLDRRIKEATS